MVGLRIIVTAKQVPDTRNISGDVMKPDGTVNRNILPTIINPEDLNAIEEALSIKESIGGHVSVITMGPLNATDVLKEAFFRGADECILLSDKRFAGSDTLATSHILKCAIEKIGKFDLIICGRQAIDGDTAQVGPQIAEKLGINQLTSVIETVDVNSESITVKRMLSNGYEKVKSDFPVLVTVTSDLNEPRSPSAKRVMAYKNIKRKADNGENDVEDYIREWNLETILADPGLCGIKGSPTKVKKIENVILTTNEIKRIPGTDEGVEELVRSLSEEHII